MKSLNNASSAGRWHDSRPDLSVTCDCDANHIRAIILLLDFPVVAVRA
jgi:hypothetical protein